MLYIFCVCCVRVSARNIHKICINCHFLPAVLEEYKRETLPHGSESWNDNRTPSALARRVSVVRPPPASDRMPVAAHHERKCTMSNRPAILAEGLYKHYGKTRALAGLDLTAEQGSVLAVLGPNCAGKTTAVRILTTLLRPDAGRAEVAGLDVVKDANALRSRIGLAGQYAAVDENLTWSMLPGAP